MTKKPSISKIIIFKSTNEIREILFDDTNWKLSKCSCCYWLKNYMCSHIIILAVTLKLVEFPQASMQIPIGQNRKRGRPNKTKKALQNLIIHHF